MHPLAVGRMPALHARVQEGVRTLSVRVGVRRVFWACIGMLEAAYLGAICMGLASQARQSRIHTPFSHNSSFAPERQLVYAMSPSSSTYKPAP